MTNTVNVKVKKLTDTAKIPTYGSEFAACCDLYADIPNEKAVVYDNDHAITQFVEGVAIQPHTTVKIGIGLAMQPPEGYYLAIYPRSGLSTKNGIRLANCVGIGDEDYRNEYMVALHNDGDTAYIVHHGDRIAQMMVVPYYQCEFEEVKELSQTGRGMGGFGSTGK